uniref:Uncharacterized protein n=1 Tax=Molossus molossus TaxID=27622 RepID=A0A7J8ERQ6_MOLMO|nr:hypothetical protein HJG59_008743 [Molossus molossus]
MNEWMHESISWVFLSLVLGTCLVNNPSSLLSAILPTSIFLGAYHMLAVEWGSGCGGRAVMSTTLPYCLSFPCPAPVLCAPAPQACLWPLGLGVLGVWLLAFKYGGRWMLSFIHATPISWVPTLCSQAGDTAESRTNKYPCRPTLLSSVGRKMT